MIIREIIDMKYAMGRVVSKFEGRISNGDANSIAWNSLDLVPRRHVWPLEPPGYVKTKSVINKIWWYFAKKRGAGRPVADPQSVASGPSNVLPHSH